MYRVYHGALPDQIMEYGWAWWTSLCGNLLLGWEVARYWDEENIKDTEVVYIAENMDSNELLNNIIQSRLLLYAPW